MTSSSAFIAADCGLRESRDQDGGERVANLFRVQSFNANSVGKYGHVDHVGQSDVQSSIVDAHALNCKTRLEIQKKITRVRTNAVYLGLNGCIPI